MAKITLEQAAKILRSGEKFVLATHINPDGDALGSALGLGHVLRRLGKDAQIYIDDKLPRNFSLLPGYEEIKTAADLPLKEKLNVDRLVILDAGIDRINRAKDVTDAPILNIDHHISNDEAADELYLDAHRAATAEIVYELTKELGVEFDSDIAVCLYTGIATDSGFFRYANTKPFTMRAAAELLEYGVKPNVISEATETRTFADLRGMAEALNTIESFADGKAVGVFLDLPLVKTLDSTEGFIDMIRTVEGADVAVMVKCQEENFCRISMRSRNVDVSKIAVKFGGGGHVRAAGCSLKMSFAEAKQTIVAAITDAFNEAEIDK